VADTQQEYTNERCSTCAAFTRHRTSYNHGGITKLECVICGTGHFIEKEALAKPHLIQE
jgi:hypothetical protein